MSLARSLVRCWRRLAAARALAGVVDPLRVPRRYAFDRSKCVAGTVGGTHHPPSVPFRCVGRAFLPASRMVAGCFVVTDSGATRSVGIRTEGIVDGGSAENWRIP